MKTQIITLEAHDDLISVRDKLAWAKTARVLLVCPKFEAVNLRFLDLKVLQRHARSLGAQLGLVTRRADVRRDAEALGIPVFVSTAAAQKESWPVPAHRQVRERRLPRRDLRLMRESVYPREASWRTSLTGRLITFAVGVMAVLAIASLFIPRAVVVLYPESQIQSVIIPVTASEAVQAVSVTGEVPARRLSVVVNAEQSLAIINEVIVPNTKARGLARFTNLGQKEINIPTGTVVSTAGENPVRYNTQHQTLLSAAVGEFVDVPIEAVLPGSSGNAPVDTIVVVEGELGVQVAVTNPKLVSGGTDKKQVGATDSDRAKLFDSVMLLLRREAEEKLKAQISSGDFFQKGTFDVSQIIAEAYDPPAGMPGKTLTLDLEVEFSAFYIAGEDLVRLSEAALNSALPEAYHPSGPPTFKVLNETVVGPPGATQVELQASRILLRVIDTGKAMSFMSGQDPDRIVYDLMNNLPMRKEPEVSLNPDWWPWMPLIPFNISIQVR